MAINDISEGIFCIAVLLRAIILKSFVFHRNSDRTCLYRQCRASCRSLRIVRVRRTYVDRAAVRYCRRCQAAQVGRPLRLPFINGLRILDRRRPARCVRRRRVCQAVGFPVIDIFRFLERYRQLQRAVFLNRQPSRRRRDLVVLRYVRVFALDYYRCVRGDCSVISADFRTLRRVLYVVRMATYQAGPRPVIRRYVRQLDLTSRILLRCRLACECYRTLRDRQLSAVGRRVRIVRVRRTYVDRAAV